MILKEDISRLNNSDLHMILEENYPDIMKSMQNENYEIECPKHLIFKELVFEDRIVGFATFELLQFYSNELALNECYVLPEYRGRSLLAKELIELIETPNISLFIRRPSKSIVKILLDNNLAVLSENDVVISFIPFMVEGGDVYKSKKIRKYVQSIPINGEIMYFSLAYDLGVEGVIFKKAPYYYPFEDDEVLISKPRLIDSYKCADKIRPRYLRNLADSVYSNRHLIGELKDNVYSRIRNDLSVENLVGNENQLNQEFTNLLEGNGLTMVDGFKIRNDVINSLDNGEIRHKGIKTRLNYLMGDYDCEQFDSIDLKCPHCENRIAFYLKTCNVCGHDLTCENTFKSVKNQITEYSEDISMINARGDFIPDGCNIYYQLIQWALERSYNLDEVYDAQCEYSCFEIIQNLGEPENYSIGLGYDSLNKIREGSGMVYAINHDYIENLTAERFRYDLENKYAISDLKSELSSHDISFEGDEREYLIEQIFNDKYFNRFLDEHFVLTKKGEDFIKNPVLKYFHDNLSDDYYYYDFKRAYLKHKDSLTLGEIAKILDREA